MAWTDVEIQAVETELAKWVEKNRNRLKRAAQELGLEVKEGRGFYLRLRQAYIDKAIKDRESEW